MQWSNFGLIHHSCRVVTFDDILWNCLYSAGGFQDPAGNARAVPGFQCCFPLLAPRTAFAKSGHMTNTSWNLFCHLKKLFFRKCWEKPNQGCWWHNRCYCRLHKETFYSIIKKSESCCLSNWAAECILWQHEEKRSNHIAHLSVHISQGYK